MSKLRNYRLAHNLSQTALAARVGVTVATISRIEAGSRSPSLALVAKLVEKTDGELVASDFFPAREVPQ